MDVIMAPPAHDEMRLEEESAAIDRLQQRVYKWMGLFPPSMCLGHATELAKMETLIERLQKRVADLELSISTSDQRRPS